MTMNSRMLKCNLDINLGNEGYWEVYICKKDAGIVINKPDPYSLLWFTLQDWDY